LCFDNLNKNETLALQVHEVVIKFAKQDFRGNQIKEREIQNKLYEILQNDDEVARIFEIIKEAQSEY
jgi:nitrogen regulatory protein PII